MNYDNFKSYSSYGEDALLNGVMKRLSWIMEENLFQQNTYIDIGSFHPVKESNTYFLYDAGWFGTLVDPNIYFNSLVHELRPKDILYNCAVDTKNGSQTFYMFGDKDSSNTLSKNFADRKVESQRTNISWTAEVVTKTINEIIDIHINYFKTGPFFLNIDIEGKDFDVIQTYSHEYKTPFVMIEDDSNDIFGESKIKKLMYDLGYAPIATTFLTTLYLDIESRYYPCIKKIGSFEK